MGEEGGGGDDGGRSWGEAVGVDVVEVEGDLEGVGGAGEALEEFEGGGWGTVAGGLGFDEEPGVAVAGDEEVDFALEFVAEVVEVEGAEAEVGPEVDGFEEVGGGEVFEAGAGVGDEAPVPEVDLGLLAQGLWDVAGPGPEGEAVEEGLEGGEPAADGIDGDVDVAGEVGEVDGLTGSSGEEEAEGFDLSGLLDAGEVAEVAAEEEFGAEAAPASVELVGAFEEGFGVAAEAKEEIEGGAIEAGGRSQGLFDRRGGEQFGDGEGVEAVEEVAAHEAVAAAAEEAEAGAAGDDESGAVGVDVEEAFEEVSPRAVFVDLVEDDVAWGGGEEIEVEGLGEGVGAAGDGEAIGLVVPGAVEVVAGALAGGGSFSGLAGTGDHGDLTVFEQMLPDDVVVDSFHSDILTQWQPRFKTNL